MGRLALLRSGPLLITIAANFMGALQFGYNVGVVSNIQTILEEFMNETITERDGEVPSEEFITNLWAVIVAMFFLGGAVGTLLNRWITKHMSRRRGFLVNIAIGTVGVALMASSRRAKLWELLLVGRLVIGVNIGIYSGLVALYLSEISPKEIRGAISNLNPLGTSVALLISQVMGFPDLLGTAGLWDVLFGLSIVPCVVQLLLLPLCVESPRYLMISQRDTDGARHALQKLRNSDDVEEEIEVMQSEMDHVMQTVEVTMVELLRHGPSLRATIIGTLSQMGLHLSGSNGVYFYSNDLLQESLGLSATRAAYLTSCVGVLAIVMTLTSTLLSDVAGRRTLQMVGLVGVIASTLAITASLVLRHHADGFDIATIVFLLVFVVFFGLGPVCIPWVLTGELFAQNARPIASAIAVTGNWASGLVVAVAFPPMQKVLGDYVFLPFCLCTALIAVYTYYHLPETKGKTTHEILILFETAANDGKGVRYAVCKKGSLERDDDKTKADEYQVSRL